MALPYIFASGTTIYASQVNANFAAVALTDLSNLSLSKTAGNVIIGTGSGFASNALVGGSGITITPGAGTVTISASGSTTLTIGLSTITSGSNNYILYNNSGTLGNYAVSGTGSTVAMATGATLTTPTIAAGGETVTPQFTPPSYAQGLVWYDSVNDGLSYYNGATGNQVIAGQQVQLQCYNATASTIPIGTPVYITGTFGAQPAIAPASNASFAASQVIGLTTQAIAASATGFVMSNGTLGGLATNAFSAGSTLYLGATAGTLTTTAPSSGAYSIVVGYVAVSNATTGKITVRPAPPASNGGVALTVGSTTISGGTTGRPLYDNAGVLGEYATLPVAYGGTGTATPSLVGGANVSVTGSWPNQTISATSTASPVTISTQSGSTYTLALTDAQTKINFTSAAAVTVTVPPNSSVAFVVGTTVALCQYGAGKVTVAAGSGVTINYISTLTLAIAGQYGVAQLVQDSANVWTLFGAIGG